jgi:hypothetical protein
MEATFISTRTLSLSLSVSLCLAPIIQWRIATTILLEEFEIPDHVKYNLGQVPLVEWGTGNLPYMQNYKMV